MNDSSGNKIVKVGNNSIVRYSNALIRRAIDDLIISPPDVVRLDNKRYKILLLSDPKDAITPLFVELFKSEGFDVTFIAPYNRLELVYTELTQNHYDMVIPTNFVCIRIPELAEEIRSKFPQIRIIVISGYISVNFQAQLKANGVDIILTLPFQPNVLLQSIRNELSPTTDNRVSILLSWSLANSFKYWLDSLGFNALWADNPEELEEIAISNNIDLAIEWQSGQLRQHRLPSLDMLKKLGKVVPIYLSLNMSLDAQTNIQELGYVDTLEAPWVLDEMRQKFHRMLTPEKQTILKGTEFWKTKY